MIDEALPDVKWVNKDQISTAHVIESATPFSDGLGKLFNNLASRIRFSSAPPESGAYGTILRIFRSTCGAATGPDIRMDGQRGGKFAGRQIIGERGATPGKRLDGDGPQVSDGASARNSICGQDLRNLMMAQTATSDRYYQKSDKPKGAAWEYRSAGRTPKC